MKELEPGLTFDADSYFFPTIEHVKGVSNEELVRVLISDDPEVIEIRDMYYLLVRSAVVVTGSDQHSKVAKLRKAFEDWCRMAQNEAARLTVVHQRNGSAIPPQWITWYDEFQALAQKGPKITVSALSREFLRNFNIIVWNSIFAETMSGVGGLFHPPPTQELARVMVP